MPSPAERFDPESVRAEWDEAADTYTAGQRSGLDYYRYEFFGPAHIGLCGEVSWRTLLDVGCGNGYFSRAMAEGGATVTGIDISPRMIAHAQEEEARRPLGISYRVMDASAIGDRFAPGAFDMATSCLALQDMPDVPGVLRGVRSALRPGSRFVVSTTHPCTDTPFRHWHKDGETKQWLCIDRYFDVGPLTYRWSGWERAFETTAVHATLEDWFTWCTTSGFQLRGLREPRPTPAAVAARPDLADAARVPYFLLLDLVAI